jgi:hypothetical protein
MLHLNKITFGLHKMIKDNIRSEAATCVKEVLRCNGRYQSSPLDNKGNGLMIPKTFK